MQGKPSRQMKDAPISARRQKAPEWATWELHQEFQEIITFQVSNVSRNCGTSVVAICARVEDKENQGGISESNGLGGQLSGRADRNQGRLDSVDTIHNERKKATAC